MPDYDGTKFDPPGPVARFVLRNPNNGKVRSNVPILLDSGADVTLLPKVLVNKLGVDIISDRQYELIGLDGKTSFASIVRLDLSFCGRTFRGQLLLIDQSWGILGRNVLNAVPLLFDGPRLTWEEYRS